MIILPPDNNNDNNSSSNPGNVSIPSNPPGKKERLHNTTTSDTKAKNPRNSKGKKGTCKIKTGGNPANYPTASQKAQRGLVSKHDSGIVMTPTKNQKPSQQIQQEDSSKSPQQVDQFPSSPTSPSSAAPRSEARPTHAISSRSFDFMAEEVDEIHSRHANDTIPSRARSKGATAQWHSIDAMLFDGTKIGDDDIDDIHDGTMVGDSILCGRWNVSNDDNDSNNVINNNNDNNSNKCNGGEDNQQPGSKSTRSNYTHTSALTTAMKIYSTRGNSEDNSDNEGIGVAATTSALAKVARSHPSPAPGNNPDFDRFGLGSVPAGVNEKNGRFGHASDTMVRKDNMVDAPRNNNSKAGLVPSIKSSTRRICNFTRFSLSTKSSSSPVISSSSSSSPPPPSDFAANAYSYSKIHKAAANGTDGDTFKAALVNDTKYDGFSSSNGRCKRIADKNERIHGFSGGCWKGDDIAFADDIHKATDGSNKSRALPQASEALKSSDRPSSSFRSTVNFLPIIYFQQRMIYPDGFFSTPPSTSEYETLSSKAPSNTTSSLTKNSTSQAEPTQSTPIQAIQSKWKVYTGVTEFGFDCYATPKYILPDGGGGDNARRKYDGNGCVGWGLDGSIVGWRVASESTSRTSSSLSEPPSVADGNPRWYTGDNLSVVDVPTASPSVTVAEEVDCDHGGMKAEVTLQPPGHIYALREICFDGQITGVIGVEVNEGGEEESGFTEDLPRDSSTKDQQRVRIITSRVVCTTETIHLQLEQSSAGTALCPAWINDDFGGINSGHIFKRSDCGYGPFFYSTGLMPTEGIPPMESQMKPPGRLILVTVPLTEIKRQMGDNFNSSDASVFVDKMDYVGRKNFTRCQNLDNDHFMGLELIHGSIRAIDHAFQVSDECTPKGTSSAKSDKKKKWRHPRKLLKSITQFRRNKHGNTASDIGDTRLSICGVAPGKVSSSAKSTSDLRGKQTSTDKSLAHGVNGSHVPRVVHYFNHGARIFSDEAILNNKIDPIEEIVCLSHSLGIYVCESGLSASECRHIIDVSEACAASAHGWSSYTYAKQTLGCREHDMLAFASKKPVMTACATIGKHLLHSDSECSRPYEPNDTDHGTYSRQESARPQREKAIVLDAREPHIVKYDLSKKERQKLDMHTDKSIWTFLIALSEGRGYDYGEGGTFFEALNSTVHLQRGQMLIFRGKLRHRGVKISFGTRYLLVGFLVEKKNEVRGASGATTAGGT